MLLGITMFRIQTNNKICYSNKLKELKFNRVDLTVRNLLPSVRRWSSKPQREGDRPLVEKMPLKSISASL